MEIDVIVQIVHKPDLIIQHHLMGNMERLLCSFGVVHVYILNFVGTMVLLSDAASTAKEWSSRVSLHH
jgi:hypothetical protein